ncbi:unnamed protein product [Effrenium voratum]|nr:unnamed protein product [Effrenium voratum]
MAWEIVGGKDKGLVVRAGAELSSPELGRVETGALVAELERRGQRLHFRLLSGSGPAEGWLTLQLGGRDLAVAVELKAAGEEPTLAAVLSPACGEAAANAALAGLRRAEGPKRLERALVLWRWHRPSRALEDLGSGSAQLALQICLSRWPEAQALALTLGLESETETALEAWQGGAGRFAPAPAVFDGSAPEVMPGIRQIDARIPVADVELGVRLFLLEQNGEARSDRPLLIYFHGNAETVDTYKDQEIFRPLRAADVSVLVVDFRGYGYSTGSPSLGTLGSDGERVVAALPGFLRAKQLPWPWPGRMALLGRSMGGIVACHLAALKGELFDKGVILESTFCGSHAPGAAAPEEPPQEASAMGGSARFWPPELVALAGSTAELCRKLLRAELKELLNDVDLSFVHMLANEDKLRAFTGKLLILHGEIDTIIPVSHATRLCDAAVFATRRLVTISKGHNDISSSDKYVTALRQFLADG